MTIIEELIKSIDNRLAELRDEVVRLEAARAELVDNGAGSRARVASAAKPRPRRRAARKPDGRVSEVAPAGKLQRLLAESDGLSTSALAERANADPGQVLARLRE